MEVHCLVKHIGNQLELQSETVENLTDQISQADYVAILCAVGEPSSAKTGILNAIMKTIRQNFELHENYSCGEFFQPKNAKDDDGQRIDGILVLTPPIIMLDNLGRRVAVVLLDVWNNFAESEDVYGKLVDFCFQVSSVQVFSLLGPLRQVTWWNGSFEASNNCSSELKQMYLQLQTTLKQEQDEIGYRNSRSTGVLAVKSYQKDRAGYFPVIIHEDEADGTAVNFSEDCFKFILKQICSRSNHGGVCRPSELRNHLSKCVTSINNTPSTVAQPPDSVPSVAVSTENAEKKQEILQAYKKRMLQVYSESTQMFLSSHELNEYSTTFVNELGKDQEEVVRTCKPHYEQLQRFHNGVESSLRLIETEVDNDLGETMSLYERVLTSRFKNQLGAEYRCGQDMQHFKSNATAATEKIKVKVLTVLHLSEYPLKDEVESLAAKLQYAIRQKLLQHLDTLQRQMELVVQTFKVFKSELDGRIQRSVCLSEREFEDVAEQGWKAMESSENGIVIRSLLIDIRDEAVQEYEDKLRQQNDQIWKSELCLAKKATNTAADFVFKLLTEYLIKYGVLTEKEVMRAFQVASDHAEKAFLTAPGFNYSPPWYQAFQSLQSTLEDRYSQVRQINLNAIRRWDRALESALRSSAEFYSQKMDHQLPKHKISLKELERTHKTCADETMSEFTVSSEVNEPTKMYWKKVLVNNQLQEWKEGYVRVNEMKKAAEEPRKTNHHAKKYPGGARKPSYSEVTKKATSSEDRSKVTVRKTLPLQLKSSTLSPSNVGVYFGPEIVVFTALLPDGNSVQLSMSPFAACSHNEIFWDEEAHQVAENTEQLFNIFSILTEPTVPIEKPCTMEFSGESVSLTAEALAVLFFKHAVSQITVQTGQKIRSCAVALPGLLPRGAKTAVKEALKLAGFSKVTLVPFTTALAMPVALSLQVESIKNPKKIVAIYHAGKFLEAALLHASPEKIEVKRLFGSLNLFEVKASDRQSHAQKIVEQVTARDLFATVTLVGDVSISAVNEGLNKAITEMDSWKPWRLRFSFKENGIKLTANPGEVSLTMAKLDASSSDSAIANGKVEFPDFDYFKSYNYELQRNSIRTTCNSGKLDIYQYFHRTGTSGFHFHENGMNNTWNYIFDIDPQTPSGQACTLAFFSDGTFRIRPPASSPGIPVHSSSCKLLTSWDQDTVKHNVEWVVKLMGRKEAETNAALDVKEEEATEALKTENAMKTTLSKLVHQVEDGLKNSGLAQGPVYDFIHDSLQECRQLLQNPMSTDQSLNVALRKLEIRSSDVVKK